MKKGGMTNMSVRIISEDMKIRACSKISKIPMSLSNYIYYSGEDGYKQSEMEFREIINSCTDSKQACDELNAHKGILYKFTPYKDRPDGYVLLATDGMGNQDLIYVTDPV